MHIGTFENMGVMDEKLTQNALKYLFPDRKEAPCPIGIALLRAFIGQRPNDVAFLEPGDLQGLEDSFLGGIAEWENFVYHYKSCADCQR